MKNISFWLTRKQMYLGIKDVTRRVGWLNLEAETDLMAIEKGQGLKKGEHIKRIGVIHVVNVRREPLSRMIDSPSYGWLEVKREGFSPYNPTQFVVFVASHNKIETNKEITRIEFDLRYSIPDYWTCPVCHFAITHTQLCYVTLNLACLKCKERHYSDFIPASQKENQFPFVANPWK